MLYCLWQEILLLLLYFTKHQSKWNLHYSGQHEVDYFWLLDMKLCQRSTLHYLIYCKVRCNRNCSLHTLPYWGTEFYQHTLWVFTLFTVCKIITFLQKNKDKILYSVLHLTNSKYFHMTYYILILWESTIWPSSTQRGETSLQLYILNSPRYKIPGIK